MRILAIDTAANLCAACVFDTQAGEQGRAVLDLGKGHAEHLLAVIDTALEAADCTFADIGAIAVSVGPGSFTGVRVGVATARGLALALKIPATGVTTLEALAAETRITHPGSPVMVRIEAGRGQAYLAGFEADGRPAFGPAAVGLEHADAMTGQDDVDTVVVSGRPTADIAIYAQVALNRLASRSDAPEKPKPLYLRDADAKPQGAFALPRKTGS